MASKIDADWTLKVACPEHSGFTLDFFCKQCRRNVCVCCVALYHSGHDIETLNVQKSEQKENLEKIEIDLKAQEERISELKKNLEKRKTEVKIMKKDCQEWSRQIHETTEEKLCSIDQDRDRRRSSVILERNDFERRVKSMTECLEKEENNIYALGYSLEANASEDIQEELEECTNAQLPRVKTYNDLKVKFEKMQSPNRFSSSSTTTLGELASSPVFEPFTSTRRRWHSEGLDREQAQGAVEIEQSEDASDLQGEMDTGSGSDCEELGAEGGLAFKSDREGVIKGQMKGNDAHSGRDDVVLSDLARHLLPAYLTPLGLRLGLSHIIINQIRFNNVLDIGNAIYEVLQEWKGTLCTGFLTEKHFKVLEQCLRKIGNEDAADWLIERLQKSTDQLGQPSSSPCQLVQPSSSPAQLGQPSSTPGQLVQPISSAGQLVQPISSAGQLGQPSLSPGQLGLSSSSASQLMQPSSSPGLVQPSLSPAQLMQPSSTPGLMQPSSSPAQIVQPSSIPVLVQPSSTPAQIVQPSSSPAQIVQPSSTPCQLVQPSSTPGLVQPSSSPCQLVQPSSSPAQLVQPSSSPAQLVQPISSLGQLGQPSSSDSQ